MLNSDEWKAKVVQQSMTLCPACQSARLTAGACGIGSMTVHQEYTCEACQYEFTAVFALLGCYAGHPE